MAQFDFITKHPFGINSHMFPIIPLNDILRNEVEIFARQAYFRRGKRQD